MNKQFLNYTKDEIENLISKLKFFIEDSKLNKSDLFYKIAYHRGYEIEKRDSTYVLKLFTSSDSEKILTVYEENNSLDPKQLLALNIADGAKKTLERKFEENPNLSIDDVLQMFKIKEHVVSIPYAESHSENELIDIFNCLKTFQILKVNNMIDISDKEFDFIRITKAKRGERAKLQENSTPACFDGLCLEKNIKKILPFSREEGF